MTTTTTPPLVHAPRRPGRLASALLAAAIGAVLPTTVATPARAALGTDTLSEGEQLVAGASGHLRSAGGQHRLAWVPVGDHHGLYQYFGSTFVWGVTGTDGFDDGTRLVLQDDGNLVLYDVRDFVLFTTRTSSAERVRLVLQDDGNLVLYTASDRVLWHSGATPSTMSVPQDGLLPGPTRLLPGHFLLSADRRYRLVMQADGNLVQYDGARPLWSTRTSGGADSEFVVQTDGNLVVYDGGRPVWQSGTPEASGDPPAALLFQLGLQADGNLVLYRTSPVDHGPAARVTWSAHSRLR